MFLEVFPSTNDRKFRLQVKKIRFKYFFLFFTETSSPQNKVTDLRVQLYKKRQQQQQLQQQQQQQQQLHKVQPPAVIRKSAAPVYSDDDADSLENAHVTSSDEEYKQKVHRNMVVTTSNRVVQRESRRPIVQVQQTSNKR